MSGEEIRRRKAEEIRGTQERRVFDGSLELRAAGEGKLALVGWACRTETEYEIGDPSRGGFVEVVKRGAFRRSLGNAPDVVLVLDHGKAASGLPLARTRSGTMSLNEDADGLKVDADLDCEDPDVLLLERKMRRGDLSGEMSFAFRVPSGGDSWSDDFSRRTITAVEINGGDVSVVTFAASPTTSSQLVARNASSMRSTVTPDWTLLDRERIAALRRVA